MRKLLFGSLGLVLLAGSAAAVVPQTFVGNANYSVLPTDVRLVPTVALSANRTWTLPSAGATLLGTGQPATGQGYPSALEIDDTNGNVGGSNSCIIVAPQSGETINGVTNSVTFCSTFGRAFFTPTSGTNWVEGYIGEVISSGLCPGSGTTATVTITIASPGVITWTGHGLTGACPVVFTTTGALPTGLTASTVYWAVPSSITTNTFQVATSVANALAGTSINTSGSQSGTQTGTAGSALSTTTAANITGVALTPGDWDCRATGSRVLGSTTSVTVMENSISATSATSSTQGSDLATFYQTAANVQGVLGVDGHVGPGRVRLAAVTNEYLVAQDTFTVSTNVAFGSLTCRRVN